MARYAQGQPVRVSTEVRDTTGSLVTPGTIVLRVKKPDGTFAIPDYAPTADSTGKYHVDIPALDLPTIGHYSFAWITTGTAAGVSPAAAFEVVDPFAAAHATLGDAKARLQLDRPGTPFDASRDEELQAMIAAAVSAQEARVGAVAPRSVTEVLRVQDDGCLWPTVRPVLAVASATVNGSSVPITTWSVTRGGRIRLTVNSYNYAYGYAAGYGYSSGFYGYGAAADYTVTYSAGRSPVPQDLVEAALLRVSAAYDTQRGPAGLPLAAEQDAGFGSSYPMLLRAQDREAPYVLRDI